MACTHELPDADARHLRQLLVVHLLVGDREHGNGHVVVRREHEGVAVDARRLLLLLRLLGVLVRLAVGALQLLVRSRPENHKHTRS